MNENRTKTLAAVRKLPKGNSIWRSRQGAKATAPYERSLDVPIVSPENKVAAALLAQGVRVTSPREPTDLISPAHRMAARMVGKALAQTSIGDPRALHVLALDLCETLCPQDRLNLARATLTACKPEDAQAVVESLF